MILKQVFETILQITGFKTSLRVGNKDTLWSVEYVFIWGLRTLS